jgi:MFS family permease
VVPPITIWHLIREGAGASGVAMNLLYAAVLAVIAWILTSLVGTSAQWIALAIGVYSAISWGQSLARRDPPTFAMVFRTRSLRWLALGFSFLAFTGYGVGFWAPPFLIRVHGASEGEVGLLLGGLSAVGGWLGVTTGGVLADRWRSQSATGRLRVGLLCAVLPLPLGYWMFTTESRTIVYMLSLPLSATTSLWIGPAASTVQDLVLPRMRGAASAAYLLIITFIGLALGPYTIGLLSHHLGGLRQAILWSFLTNVIAALLILRGMQSVASDEATRMERARAAGEPGA